MSDDLTDDDFASLAAASFQALDLGEQEKGRLACGSPDALAWRQASLLTSENPGWKGHVKPSNWPPSGNKSPEISALAWSDPSVTPA